MFELEYTVDTPSKALGNRTGTVWLVEQSALIEAPAGKNLLRRLLQPKTKHAEVEIGHMPNFSSSTLQAKLKS